MLENKELKSKGLIYIITNQINRKQYIGQTTQNLSERWSQHKCDSKRRNTAIALAINKYSSENFIIEILEDNIDYIDLDNKEIEYIKIYNTITPNGYNISDGGQAFRTDDFRKEMSEKMTGENNPMYGKFKELNPFYGKTHTIENRKIIAEKSKNNWDNLSKEDKQKNNDMLDEMRIKMVEKTGGGFNGKHHSEKSKEVIRAKMKEREFAEEHRQRISENSSRKRKVIMLDKITEEPILEFDSMTFASQWLRLNTNYSKAKPSEISNVCLGKKKSAYGYKWKYV
jgi:group I intron endonuclease